MAREFTQDEQDLLSKIQHNSFKPIPVNLQGDKDFVLEAVKRNGNALQYASTTLQDDDDIVLQAVEQDGQTVNFASIKLQSNEIFMTEATNQEGISIKSHRNVIDAAGIWGMVMKIDQ